ncbi:hypothetical protein SEVIR_2G361601v4 [Setaria viridis]
MPAILSQPGGALQDVSILFPCQAPSRGERGSLLQSGTAAAQFEAIMPQVEIQWVGRPLRQVTTRGIDIDAPLCSWTVGIWERRRAAAGIQVAGLEILQKTPSFGSRYDILQKSPYFGS